MHKEKKCTNSNSNIGIFGIIFSILYILHPASLAYGTFIQLENSPRYVRGKEAI